MGIYWPRLKWLMRKGTYRRKYCELNAKPPANSADFMNHKTGQKALAKTPLTVGERNYTAYDIDNRLLEQFREVYWKNSAANGR